MTEDNRECIRHNAAERFLQSFTVFTYMSSIIFLTVFGWPMVVLIIYYSRIWRIPLLLYVAWIIVDRGSGETGIRRNERFRRMTCWKYFNDYFPIKLVKLAELPPDKNYIIASFPHGVLASGIFGCFGNYYGGFAKTYPGLTSWLLTLNSHFHNPVTRELLLLGGVLPASVSCMNRFLSSDKKGQTLVLVVGGAQESFYMEPGKYIVNLKGRKGFIKVALRNGAPIVPAITFGEPEIYRQVRFKDGSFLHNLQLFLKKLTGIAPIIFYGRFAFAPYRKPLYTVVGAPIDVKKVEEPTQEEIDKLHAQFMLKLNELFEDHKSKYIENASNIHLTVI